MTRQEVLHRVLGLVEGLTNEWEIAYRGEIGAETSLIADLTLESIDIVTMGGAIEEHFGHEGLPFEKLLMKDGRYVDDIKIGELVDFLCTHLRNSAGER